MTSLCLSLVLLHQAAAPANPVIENIDLDQAEVTRALKLVAHSAGLTDEKFKIQPDVEGVITVSLKRVPLENVFRLIVRQVDGGVELRDGVYVFFRRAKTPTNCAVTLELQNAKPDHAFRVLCDLAGVPCRIDTTKFRDEGVNIAADQVKFELELDRLVAQQNVRYRVEKGIYIIY